MRIGIPREEQPGETLVAATPKTTEKLIGLGYDVIVEAGAGAAAKFPDEAYVQAGASIGSSADVWAADVVAKVNEPTPSEIARLAEGSTVVARMTPDDHPELIEALQAKRANGLNLLATHPWGEAIAYLWSQNRHYGAPFPYYSALVALLPGAATYALPWQWWGHLTTFVCFAAAVWLTARAGRLDRNTGWIVPLALTASPTLLALALCGMPWATAFLPHALALWLVLDPRTSHRPLVSLADHGAHRPLVQGQAAESDDQQQHGQRQDGDYE